MSGDLEDYDDDRDDCEGLFTEPVVLIEKVDAQEGASITRLSEPLNEQNWIAWRERMKCVLCLCSVDGYAKGLIALPDVDDDPDGVVNWKFNDNYAQTLIINNITSAEMVHVSQCETAKAMWDSLEAVHDSKGHQTIVSTIRNLFHTSADDNTNISEHLNKLKQYWERINLLNDKDFTISDVLFKVIISSSLPLSWDAFTEPYVGGRKGVVETDPKKLMRSQEFIGILKEEYLRCQTRAQKAESVNQAVSKPSLAERIASSSKGGNGKPCKHCGRNNHNTNDCIYLGKSKCSTCDKFHMKECWEKNKGKRKRDEKSKGRDKGKKKQKKEEETNEGAETVEVVFNIEEQLKFDNPSDEGQHFNIDTYNACNMNGIDERVAYYDWLADSATT